jgi:hypothetical protein
MRNYKEDIAMMNEDALYKEPSYPRIKSSLLVAGLTLISPGETAFASQSYVIVEDTSPIEQLYNSYPDTPVAADEDNLKAPLPKDVRTRLQHISRLPEDWDGYGASSATHNVIKNTTRFLYTLQQEGIKMPKADDIYPTPYGTMVIELYNQYGLVSLEISDQQVGYFTDYKGRSNWGSEGLDTDFNSIPEQLKEHLKA